MIISVRTSNPGVGHKLQHSLLCIAFSCNQQSNSLKTPPRLRHSSTCTCAHVDISVCAQMWYSACCCWAPEQNLFTLRAPSFVGGLH